MRRFSAISTKSGGAVGQFKGMLEKRIPDKRNGIKLAIIELDKHRR